VQFTSHCDAHDKDNEAETAAVYVLWYGGPVLVQELCRAAPHLLPPPPLPLDGGPVLLHLPLHQGDGRRGLAHPACNTSLYCHHRRLDHAKVHAIFWIMNYSCLFPRIFYTWLYIYSNSSNTFRLIHYNETSQEKKLRCSSDKESPPPPAALRKIMQKMQLTLSYSSEGSPALAVFRPQYF
jgi:hypothetical protein